MVTSLRLITLSLSLAFILTSCKSDQKKTINYAYFGGHISDAVNKKLTIKKDRQIIKEIDLDQDNTFGYKLILEGEDEGLYNFYHGNENQYFYVKKGDSIVFNLNPKAFDETLSFSGKGFEKSEFIIKMFLINEKENRAFREFYKLEPEDFMQKIDSAKKAKSKFAKAFFKTSKLKSKKFKSLVEITVDYSLYKKIEYYLSAHKKITNKNEKDCLPASFYKHREEVKIESQKDFLHYYAFSTYLINYLNNIAETAQIEKEKIDLNQKTKDFVIAAQEINNQKITDELITAIFLQNLIRKTPNNLETLKFIRDYISDSESKSIISELITDREQLEGMNEISNIQLKDHQNKNYKLLDLLPKNKISVLYFWSDEFNSELHLTKRIKKLYSNFSKVEFIGINFSDKPQTKKSKIPNQYFLNQLDPANNWIRSGFPLTLILSENGEILKKDCNINDSQLKNTLKYHIKKELTN